MLSVPPFFEAWRFLFANKVYWNFDADDLIFVNAEEVDMFWEVCNRVELDVLADYRLLLAFVVDFNHVRHELTGVQRFHDFV